MRWLLFLPFTIVRLLIQSTLLALGQIWANKMRSVLTTIGIVIGVASVTSVIASLSGLKAKVLADFESFGTNKIYISPQRPPGSNLHWWNIRFEPRNFDNILEHCPSVDKITMIARGGRYTVRHGEKAADGVSVHCVEPSWNEIENRPVMFGRPLSVLDDSQSRQVCLIVPELRDELNLDRDCIGQTITFRGKAFRIIGVIENRPQMAVIGGGNNSNNLEIYIPFKTRTKLTSHSWIWSIASSKSTDVSDEAKAEITFFLRKTRNIKPGEPDTFRVQSIESEIKKFKETAVVITLVAGGIVGISLLVGGVGIMNIMLVSVSERTREIGLRKAVGAKKSAILTQFLVEAVVLCFVGGLAGVGV